EYAKERVKEISNKASTQLNPGRPEGRPVSLPDLDATVRTTKVADLRYGVGEPTFAALPPVDTWLEKEVFVGDTCHLDVIDKDGNMVSATPSGGWLSSSPVIPKLGFPLGTRLQMTWLDDGVPGQVHPRKRPNTTLSPGLALRDGKPY